MNREDIYDEKDDRSIIEKLRKRIYLIESSNIHKKNPKKDNEIVEDIIRVINQTVEEDK